MKWQLLDTGKATAEKNMLIDADLLKNLQPAQCVLRFYDWVNDSATYGYFTDPFQYLNQSEMRRKKLEIARRSTGGGIIFHLSDLTFSVFIPSNHPNFSVNTLENYKFINSLVLQSVQPLSKNCLGLLAVNNAKENNSNFCMAAPTIFDVMIGKRKVAGGAQRRTNKGFLHQGSISLALPPKSFLEGLLTDDMITKMQQNTYSLLGTDWTQSDLEDARHNLKSNLTKMMFG